MARQGISWNERKFAENMEQILQCQPKKDVFDFCWGYAACAARNIQKRPITKVLVVAALHGKCFRENRNQHYSLFSRNKNILVAIGSFSKYTLINPKILSQQYLKVSKRSLSKHKYQHQNFQDTVRMHATYVSGHHSLEDGVTIFICRTTREQI